MRATGRVDLQPAYLLHQRDYRDSSRICEFLTRDHGRVALFARGVRRAGSRSAALLQPFAVLSISWSGSCDGGTLRDCEPGGQRHVLPPALLMSGFYLNELLLKLLAREDPHPDVYDAYELALGELAGGSEQRSLRLFEKRLLEALGVGIDYARVAATGAAVEPSRYYYVRPEAGVTGEASAAANAFSGRELLALAAEDLGDAQDLAAARRLLRAALDALLDGREIRTRKVARALRTGEQAGAPRPATGTDNEESR